MGAATPLPQEPLLRAQGLVRTYGEGAGATRALRGASVHVAAGELVVIQGRSGSGKTTLLNLVSGLDRADKGTVHLLGAELGTLSTDERLALRAQGVGFIFQDPGLVPELRLWENVAMAARLRGLDPGTCKGRAHTWLARVGLAGLEARFPGEISGGEAQRVSVARALSKEPQLVLADEPTANLDHETAELVAGLLQAYVAEHGAAALVVTHDDIMAGRGTRRYTLIDGRLDGDGGDGPR